MNLAYTHLLPADFAPSSRVWIYQCSRPFTLSEVLQVEDMLNNFSQQWHAHGAGVKSFATVFFGQFIILMADETHTEVSGCSTDSSVRMIKEIEKQFEVTLFDRQTLAFVVKDKTQLLPLSQLAYAMQNNFITADTLYFNNTVQTKKELESNWLISLKDSWLARKLALPPVIS
ncbi:hypothetical protein [Agriterribacter sp.]|uniref:hypothetical protein n=1 Tax=Agriterribacter sp. TaxID=2821509 RepID=UPI002C6712B1|nr:hypothetical protein [Agriterribacter sp.]HRO47090.1 hypothetical protein [Agriterribacter sp.]HRQ19539.1 hypothetical protein [Agriterribacter sp.]